MGSERRQLMRIDWRHAIGEFVLIFVGILAALATADWDEHRRERNDERATPIDWESLVADPVFHNLVHYRLMSLRGNSLAAHERAIAGAEQLSAEIESWLARN